MKIMNNSLILCTLLSSMIVGLALATSSEPNLRGSDIDVRELMTSGTYPIRYPCDHSEYEWYKPCGEEVGQNTRVCVDTREGQGMCVLRDLVCDTPCDESTSVCVGGQCECLVGYSKNQNDQCVPSCQEGKCGGVNSHCSNGHCVCNDGYGFNHLRTTCIEGGSACFEQCGLHATCDTETGDCKCWNGYVKASAAGEPLSCAKACPVEGCGQHSECKDGYCQCMDGFVPIHEGDGSQCKHPCDGVTCGTYSHCDNGTCKCNAEFKPIVDGDESECESICANVSCSKNSTCVAGACECKAGYEPKDGTSQDECKLSDERPSIIVEVCDPEECENGTCIENHCTCNDGYIKSPWGRCRLQLGQGNLLNKIRESPNQRDPKEDCDPNDCENGTCVNGSCECNDGYIMNRFGRCRVQLGQGSLSNQMRSRGGGN